MTASEEERLTLAKDIPVSLQELTFIGILEKLKLQS